MSPPLSNCSLLRKKLDNEDLGGGGEGKTRAPILPSLSFYAPSCFATGQFPQKKEARFLNKNFPLENEATPLESGGRARAEG